MVPPVSKPNSFIKGQPSAANNTRRSNSAWSERDRSRPSSKSNSTRKCACSVL